MNAIPLINNIPKTNINNEKQLRQEINTSLVALKKEAGTLEGLINEAAQMLVTINNRIATLENDTVKKSDIVDVVQSGNLQPVTSNAVASEIIKKESGIIATDTDLNNYLTCGLYVSNGDSLYTNSPVRLYFGLWVIRTAGYQQEVGDEKYRNQILFHYTTGDIYTRSYYFDSNIQGMSWSSWQKVTFLKKKTITGTTNANGILYKGNSTLSGSEILIGAVRTDIADCICFIGWGGSNGYWIKVCDYDLTTKANTAVTIDVYYL